MWHGSCILVGMSDNAKANEGGAKAVPCFVLILRRAGQPDRRIVLDSLSDALAAARHDAAWLCGIGSVLISVLGNYNAATPQKG